MSISEDVADAILAQVAGAAPPVPALASLPVLSRDVRDRAIRSLILPGDDRLAILDVVPVAGRIMSGQPFALEVRFAASALQPPRLASVAAEWAGEPFVVETFVRPDDLERGSVVVGFDERQTLPVGSATFEVRLLSAVGAMAAFRITCAVLPSNPLALVLGPNGDFVTGTWSARGIRHGNAYDTGVALTLMNGDGSPVAMQSGFHWRFWGSGVGSYIVEEGDGNFNVPVSVPSFGTWGGWIAFHSPQGSGIYGFYDSKKDMTIEITMRRQDGTAVAGSITARTMFRFGVNVTEVAGEDFTSQEFSDLVTAANVTRSIYERRDLTFDIDYRYIPHDRVGPYEIITTFDEFHNLLSDWSGPDTNDNIDAFIVQAIAIAGTSIDGIDGSIPGPTSHAGPDSGVIASKTGFVDGSGSRRLSSAYLGMLIGHELGHYLGLVHVSGAGNLMLPSSGTTDTNLTYGQYKTMIGHGWVFIG
ncbi:MAG: hypothetical protein M3082_08180 [Candidatus Dormibacteraeota bacterium]|nr:hypothetical protein [Candidatus Dormibacteraeota bacterium]